MFSSTSPIKGRRQSGNTFNRNLPLYPAESLQAKKHPLHNAVSVNDNNSSAEIDITREGSAAADESHNSSRASRQTFPVSYSYGAPTHARNGSQGSGSHQRRPSKGGTDEGQSIITSRSKLSDHDQDDSLFASHQNDPEPAAVRYARLKQRTMATGSALPPPETGAALISQQYPPYRLNSHDTSINVATAFNQHRNANSIPPDSPRNSSSSSRKRRKNNSDQDPDYRPTSDDENDEAMVEDIDEGVADMNDFNSNSAAHRKKRSRQVPPDQSVVAETSIAHGASADTERNPKEGHSKSRRRSSQKHKDETWKPGDTSESSDSGDEPASRSRSKRRGTVSRPSNTPVIEILRDSRDSTGDDPSYEVRGESYDYAPEERIFKQLERDRDRDQLFKRPPLLPTTLPTNTIYTTAHSQGNSFSSSKHDASSKSIYTQPKTLRLRKNSIPPKRVSTVEETIESSNDFKNTPTSNNTSRQQPKSVGALLGRAIRLFAITLFRPFAFLLNCLSFVPWIISKWAFWVVLGLIVLEYFAIMDVSNSRQWIDKLSFKSSHNHPTFTVPDIPPSDLPELIQRLTSLESSMAKVYTINGEILHRADVEATATSENLRRISVLENTITQQNSRSSKETERIESLMAGAKSQLENLAKDVGIISSDLNQEKSSTQSLSEILKKVNKRIESLDGRVNTVEEQSKAFKDIELRIKAIALEAIDTALPSHLLVRFNRQSGSLHVDPSFWKYLQQSFVSRDEISSGSPSSPVEKADLSQFFELNKHQLQQLIDEDIKGKQRDGAVMSKESFLNILQREVKSMKLDLESRVDTGIKGLEEDISKVHRQQHSNPYWSRYSSSDSKDNHSVTIKSTDGKDITDAIKLLVDSAIKKNAKDILAKPDYALFSAGGRIIPSLTSPTYEVKPSGLARQLLASVTGTGVIKGRPPVTALHPDNSVGSCWPFAGKSGQLGVMLSREILVEDVTIEHAPKELAFDLSSAPKDFEVWGIVDDDVAVARLRAYRESNVQSEDEVEDDVIPVSSLPPSPRHVLLTAGTYDPDASDHVQSFPVIKSTRELNLPVSIVVVRMLSTHGHPAYGCLYRVRVGGAIVSQ